MKRSEIPRQVMSPKQQTLLRKIARHGLPVDDARGILQTTLGSLYHRGFVEIRHDNFLVTEAGSSALAAQTSADITRSAARFDAPFARVIAELAMYSSARRVKGKPPGRAPVIVSSRRRLSAA